MRLWTVYVLVGTIGGPPISMVRDRASWNPRRMWRSLKAGRESPWAQRQVLQRLRDYRRRDFHPDDHDTTKLIADWRQRLFGIHGKLQDRAS